MEKFRLKKFAIRDGEVEYQYIHRETIQGVEVENEYKVRDSRPIHSDLRRELAAFEGFFSFELAMDVEITSIAISGNGYIASGYAENISSRRYKFKSPRLPKDDMLNALEAEVYAYINGKVEEMEDF